MSEIEYSVGLPTAMSDDPGTLQDGPVDPPRLAISNGAADSNGQNDWHGRMSVRFASQRKPSSVPDRAGTLVAAVGDAASGGRETAVLDDRPTGNGPAALVPVEILQTPPAEPVTTLPQLDLPSGNFKSALTQPTGGSTSTIVELVSPPHPEVEQSPSDFVVPLLPIDSVAVDSAATESAASGAAATESAVSGAADSVAEGFELPPLPKVPESVVAVNAAVSTETMSRTHLSPSRVSPGNVSLDADPIAAELRTEPDVDSLPGAIRAAKGSERQPEESPLELAGDYRSWSVPALTLVVTGNQHGYIEPCGCTGLDRQKGGVARRFTFLRSLRQDGWNIAPIDVGNQVRRFGAQAEIKLQQTAEALSEMGYVAVGVGPDDAKLGVGPMLAVAAGVDDSPFHSGNVVLFDDSMMPSYRVIDRDMPSVSDGGGIRVGVTSILDPPAVEGQLAEEITLKPPAAASRSAMEAMTAEGVNYRVLLFFGEESRAEELVREVEGFDLVVVSGGYGEPTFQPIAIDGSPTVMIVTGNKGMYAGLVGLDMDADSSSTTATGVSMRYARVPLTHQLEDAPEMRELMSRYQDQLRQVGLQGLGLLPPIPHSSGDTYVGSAKCGSCHTSAMEVWENSMHAEATEHLVQPPAERGDVARHFDPECLSCHVTGWNPQQYYPYQTGYLSLEASAHLTGNGCENCHGPGAAHSAAEAEGSTVDADQRDVLRLSMQLPLEKAREKCMECHDLDNSPDFHEPDAFEDVYWPEVEHYGVD